MANIPKKISVGNRTVVGNQVLNAQDDLVQREQLNRILKSLDQRLVALGVRVDAIPTGGGGDPAPGASYELSVDPTNFSLDSVGENAWYLDIIPGGIGTTELADLAVTGDKIDFSTFDSDEIVEGTTNLYFTDERAQDAVGIILDDSANVTLDYDDGAPSIVADLTDTTATPGSFGSSSEVATYTVDAKGRLTASGEVPIAFPTNSFSDTFGDGVSTSYPIVHGLGTRNVVCQAYLTAAPYTKTDFEIEHTDVNTVTVKMNVAPSTDEYTITVIK